MDLDLRKASVGGRAGPVPDGLLAEDRDGFGDRARTRPPQPTPPDVATGHDAVSQKATQAPGFLDLLPGAGVLIDSRLRVVQANAAAQALLAERDGLVALRHDKGLLQLAARTAAETTRLRAALASAVLAAESGAGGPADALTVSCLSDHRTLVVVVTPLPPPATPPWTAAGQSVRALVQIIDPHASAAAQTMVLRRAVGLTTTESRVAALVAEGLTTPQIAAALHLSPSTVRTHLAHCFDKTGVRSQVALARLIASIAGALPGAPTSGFHA